MDQHFLDNLKQSHCINSTNKRIIATSFSSFIFSTLYTNISHNKLLKVLCELTDFCFKAKKGDYTTVDKYGAI